MEAYTPDIEAKMTKFSSRLSEKDRRRYAAIEAAKLGHGGVEYIARLLGCDPKTIRPGLQELDEADDPAADRVRKKGWPTTRECIPARAPGERAATPGGIHRG